MDFKLVRTKDTREYKPGTYVRPIISENFETTKTEDLDKAPWHEIILDGLFKDVYFLAIGNDANYMFCDNPLHGYWTGKGYDRSISFNINEYQKLKHASTEKFDRLVSKKLIDKCLNNCFEFYLDKIRSITEAENDVVLPSITKLLSNQYVLPLSLVLNDDAYQMLVSSVHFASKKAAKNTYLDKYQKIAYHNITAEVYDELDNQSLAIRQAVYDRYVKREKDLTIEDNFEHSSEANYSQSASEYNFFNQVHYLDFSDPSKNLEAYFIVNGNFNGYYLVNTPVTQDYQKEALLNWSKATGIALNLESLNDGATKFCSNPEKGYFKGFGNKTYQELSDNANGGYSNSLLFGIPIKEMLKTKDIKVFDALIAERLISDFVMTYWQEVSKTDMGVAKYADNCYKLPKSIITNPEFSSSLLKCFELGFELVYPENAGNEKCVKAVKELREYIEAKKLEIEENKSKYALEEKTNS